MTSWTAGNGNMRANRTFPLGPLGVGLLAAVLGGLAGLLIPMAWIEEASWQLYLDQLIAAARPPLGVTARLAAVAVLALGAGLVGWLIANWLRVRASVGSVTDWWASMRGQRADDEPDAPSLRSADRHPDAPARRPFSAARDVPVDEPVAFESAWEAGGEDADELLLDAHFDEAVVDGPAEEPIQRTHWVDLDQVDEADMAPSAPVANVAQPIEAGIAAASVPVAGAAPVPSEPIDLSIAKLDELIARLESGLSRRETAATLPGAAQVVPSAPAVAPGLTDQPADIARPGGTPTEEPSFPQDPALAAALATLRRMNRAS